MKYYKIGEISKLYEISVDILRYYEREGLLLPEKRGKNGYRYYSNRQIWKLGTIRALRQLGVGLEEIREYLGERSLESTSKLIDFQLKVVNEKLETLVELKESLEQKKKYLDERLQEVYGEIKRVVLAERRCFKRYKSVVTDWEIDLELKKLKYHADSQEGEHFAESKVGAIMDPDGYRLRLYNIFEGTFIIDPEGDEILRGGDYLTLIFSGNYNAGGRYYDKIKEYIRENKLSIDGEILEMYKIDIYETDREDEFITEIQIPIKEIH